MANSKDSEVEEIPVEAVEAIPADDADAKPAKPQSRKKSKSAIDLKMLYPPSPDDVPEDLTEYPTSYVKQENRLLAGLFLVWCSTSAQFSSSR